MHELTVNQFNFVERQHEPYISGVELSRKLGYKSPNKQATKIWNKHKDFLLDESVCSRLESTDGKTYETRCYTKTGALLFISKCHSPVADSITKKVIKAFVSLEEKFNSSKASHSAIRAEEKQIFKDVMDDVQIFQNYQLAQGSKNSKHVYSNVIRTVKAQLGFPQTTKPVDMDSKQLVAFGTGLMVFGENLKGGMQLSLPYKEVYAEAKVPLKSLAENIKPVLCQVN